MSPTYLHEAPGLAIQLWLHSIPTITPSSSLQASSSRECNNRRTQSLLHTCLTAWQPCGQCPCFTHWPMQCSSPATLCLLQKWLRTEPPCSPLQYEASCCAQVSCGHNPPRLLLTSMLVYTPTPAPNFVALQALPPVMPLTGVLLTCMLAYTSTPALSQ